jgi:hypothetical protein
MSTGYGSLPFLFAPVDSTKQESSKERYSDRSATQLGQPLGRPGIHFSFERRDPVFFKVVLRDLSISLRSSRDDLWGGTKVLSFRPERSAVEESLSTSIKDRLLDGATGRNLSIPDRRTGLGETVFLPVVELPS